MARVEQRAVWGQVFDRLMAYLSEGGIAERRMAEWIGKSPSLLSKMKRGEGNPARYAGKMMAFLRRYGALENPAETLDWWALLGYHPSDAEMRRWYPGWRRSDCVGLLDQTWDLLDIYVERKAEGQEKIYYLFGEDLSSIAHSPHLDPFKASDTEVLYLTETVDSFMMVALKDFEDLEFQNIADADVDVPESEAPQGDSLEDKLFNPLLKRFNEVLGERVSAVREAKRLTESPARLVAADGQPGGDDDQRRQDVE